MKFDQLTEHAEGKLLSGIIDRVGQLVINNPERHNAISMAMYQAGAAEVTRMAADPEARLLVIRGAGGKAFASGADISKFEKERPAPRMSATARGQRLRFGVQFPEADHRDDPGIPHRWRHGSGGGL